MKKTAETEIDQLRAELWQSSNRETSIHSTARKSIKELEAKLDNWTKEQTKVLAELQDQRTELAQAEETINAQSEAGKKQREWFEE